MDGKKIAQAFRKVAQDAAGDGEQTFYITYKKSGSGFDTTNKSVKAKSKSEAIKKLRDQLGFNITVKNVDVLIPGKGLQRNV